MAPLRFKLTRSGRVCCRGHTDTYEIEGEDPNSQSWLANWKLYCHTCKALTLDLAEFRAACRRRRPEGAIGFVTQVPLKLRIVPREQGK